MCVCWSVILRTCYESDSAQSVSGTGRLCTLGAAPDRTCSPALGARAQEINGGEGGVRIQRLRKDQRLASKPCARTLHTPYSDARHTGLPGTADTFFCCRLRNASRRAPARTLSVPTWEQAFNVCRVNMALAHQRSLRFQSRSCLGLDGEASLQDADSGPTALSTPPEASSFPSC